MNHERIETMTEALANPAVVECLKPENLKYFPQVSPKEARVVFADNNVRRSVKKAMKKHICRHDKDVSKHIDLINQFCRVDEEYFDLVWIIRGDIDNAINVLDELGVPWEGIKIMSDYDCTGKEFREVAVFHQLADRVIVTQAGGLDV
jgi:hypothetical protein